jgi:hypothetical protein
MDREAEGGAMRRPQQKKNGRWVQKWWQGGKLVSAPFAPDASAQAAGFPRPSRGSCRKVLPPQIRQNGGSGNTLI